MKIANPQIDNYIKNIAQEKIAGCLLFGSEASVVSARFNIIAKKIVSDLSDPFLVTNISKERLSEDRSLLIDEFYSLSFLGGRKLILIKDVDANTAAAMKDLLSDRECANKSENFILIQAGDLDKNAPLRKLTESVQTFAAIACYEDDERVIKKFIESELTRNQIKFNFQAITYLSEKFGKNRQVIKSELDKIISYLGDEKDLTLEIIDKAIGSESEITAGEFINSFAAQKFDTALIQAEKLFKNGFEAITLIRFLSNYLQKLYHAKCEIEFNSVSFDEAVKSQKLFFKTEIEFRKSLKVLNLTFLKEKLKNLEEIEIKIKSSSISAKLLFTGFVQDCAKSKKII
jgi:DNA polymerase III subunit delta